MSFSPILALYRAASAGLGAFAGPYLRARARAGKEDPTRLGERFGHAREPRPAGALVWLHGASVGESGVALQLAEALGLRDASLSFLITTGTLTSAERVARRLPPRTRHAFAPLDRTDVVRRFLGHWRPDLGVFVESEIWPNLILGARRAGIPLALVNARMSPQSIGRWARWPNAARTINSAFTLTLAADRRTAEALGALRGEAAPALGNLKLAADPPSVDPEQRAQLEKEIGTRPVWIAASTHAGEDEIALAAHELVRRDWPGALLILVPRHPDRGAAVAALALEHFPALSTLSGGLGNAQIQQFRPLPGRKTAHTVSGSGLGAPRRSLGHKIGEASVYVADTMGELGLFYAIAPVVLVAGSLLPHLKGHNPAEAAKLGAAIITGPYVESFQDVFEALFAANGAVQVRDAPELAAAISAQWRDPAACARRVALANTVIEQSGAALHATVDRLVGLLPAPQAMAADARA